jgi:lipoate-protein ligase A
MDTFFRPFNTQRLIADAPAYLTGPWTVRWWDGSTSRQQMAIDEQLAAAAQATVRLFRWNRPAMSLGLRQPVPAWVDASALSAHGVDVIERPTGGGIAVHGSDLSFSVVAPLSPGWRIRALLETTAISLTSALRTIGVRATWHPDAAPAARITYCLTEPSPYALMVGARKLGGLAVRRTRVSWLIQGSLLVRELPAVFDLVMPASVRQAFREQTISAEEARGEVLADVTLVHAVHEAWGAYAV